MRLLIFHWTEVVHPTRLVTARPSRYTAYTAYTAIHAIQHTALYSLPHQLSSSSARAPGARAPRMHSRSSSRDCCCVHQRRRGWSAISARTRLCAPPPLLALSYWLASAPRLRGPGALASRRRCARPERAAFRLSRRRYPRHRRHRHPRRPRRPAPSRLPPPRRRPHCCSPPRLFMLFIALLEPFVLTQ